MDSQQYIRKHNLSDTVTTRHMFKPVFFFFFQKHISLRETAFLSNASKYEVGNGTGFIQSSGTIQSSFYRGLVFIKECIPIGMLLALSFLTVAYLCYYFCHANSYSKSILCKKSIPLSSIPPILKSKSFITVLVSLSIVTFTIILSESLYFTELYIHPITAWDSFLLLSLGYFLISYYLFTSINSEGMLSGRHYLTSFVFTLLLNFSLFVPIHSHESALITYFKFIAVLILLVWFICKSNCNKNPYSMNLSICYDQNVGDGIKSHVPTYGRINKEPDFLALSKKSNLEKEKSILGGVKKKSDNSKNTQSSCIIDNKYDRTKNSLHMLEKPSQIIKNLKRLRKIKTRSSPRYVQNCKSWDTANYVGRQETSDSLYENCANRTENSTQTEWSDMHLLQTVDVPTYTNITKAVKKLPLDHTEKEESIYMDMTQNNKVSKMPNLRSSEKRRKLFSLEPLLEIEEIDCRSQGESMSKESFDEITEVISTPKYTMSTNSQSFEDDNLIEIEEIESSNEPIYEEIDNFISISRSSRSKTRKDSHRRPTSFAHRIVRYLRRLKSSLRSALCCK